MEKVLAEREPKTDWFNVLWITALMGLLGWALTDLLFENAILSICGGVIFAAAFGMPAYRSAMKIYGDKL